jgi:deoxyribonuclease IV
MFGSHLSIAGGLHKALLAAGGYGMETVQIFTKNQRQWKARPLGAEAVAEFRFHAERLGFRKMVAHDSYLINLAAREEGLWEKSREAFAEEMWRCDQLGIAYLVTHPGAHVGSGEEAGIARVVEGMKRVLSRADLEKGQVMVLLETTAGQGTSLGYRLEQIAAMLAGLDAAGLGRRVGVCVDTAHLLAAEYDITTAEGMRGVLAEIDRVIPGGGVGG